MTMSPVRFFSSLLAALLLTATARGAEPLQTFTIRDYLGHAWNDELVHFRLDAATTAQDLTLTDEQGAPIPCQFSDLTRQSGRVRGTVWTVVSVPADGSVTLALRPGKPPAGGVSVTRQGQRLILSNGVMGVALPAWSNPARPVELTEVPAPLLAVNQEAGPWLGEGKWVNTGPAVQVTQASTEVIESGPVRVTVRQRLAFVGGRTYTMQVQLAARQPAALITEDTDLEAPATAFRFSLQPGLGADRVYWWNNYWQEPKKGLTPSAPSFDRESVICGLRPWSFWWLPDIATWAGFYQEGGAPFVGVLALRPSRWSPDQWEGFDRTQIPITARADGSLDLTFGLLAWTKKDAEGKQTLLPLHREWALTVGRAQEQVTPDGPRAPLRQQLIKYSEFPLDEVKDYGFDFQPATRRTSPWLILTREDVERGRRLVNQLPILQVYVEGAKESLAASHSEQTLQQEGEEAYYRKNYLGNNQATALRNAFLGSEDPVYGRLMAAAVKGATQQVFSDWLGAPLYPCLGRYGPWPTSGLVSLLFNYDLIAGQGYLTAEEEARVRSVLVMTAHILEHPDLWNNDRGLCSANPNMTSSIRLALGLVGLYLDGHPQAPRWRREAEQELQRELRDWISPGGAWVENPGYQVVSLWGLFPLAQALRNVGGRDYFADPQLKATMDYFGWLLTPPDVRYPVKQDGTIGPVMTLPAIGDNMMTGLLSMFNGWMAAATAPIAPRFSAEQEFFHAGQAYYLGNCGYFPGNSTSGWVDGLGLALVNPELPATPPEDLGRAFPGFGTVMRNSWTSPQATYLCHRTGPNLHHYHDDAGSLVFYAKGAPLCLDFGYDNGSKANLGREGIVVPWMHNLVSFDKPHTPFKWGPTTNGKVLDFCSLRGTADYSSGESYGSGNQRSTRHILLLKSNDMLGANYAVVRDVTQDGQAGQQFFFNLWCLTGEPQTTGNLIHFPARHGVDLDLHVLSPARLEAETDHVNLERNNAYVMGLVDVEQWGVHLTKTGSQEDFLTVLYPRAAGQPAAEVTGLAGDAALEVKHMEGADWILLSPGKATTAQTEAATLSGEIALVRRYTDGRLRLAAIKGEVTVSAGGWRLSSGGPTALQVAAEQVSGESSGEAHVAVITVPADWREAAVLLDGKPLATDWDGQALTLALPAGYHFFTLRRK